MGVIKFKGEVVYEGPLAHGKMNDNWCNSMCEYYPNLSVFFFEKPEDTEVKHQFISVKNLNEPTDYRHLEYIYDDGQFARYHIMLEQRRMREEARRLDYHKMVRVVRGRKVPIGTEGEIFWMTNADRYGRRRIGLRLKDDSRVFLASSNVKTIASIELGDNDPNE